MAIAGTRPRGATAAQVLIAEDTIETMAIAGTRPRSATTAAQDAELEEELVASAKDNYENEDNYELEVTARYIQERVGAVAQDISTSDIFVLKLRHVQHLARRIRAVRRPSDKDGQTFIGLLQTLNPTPAVCGESRPVATEFIRRQERFDRGFYGGPVGFVSSVSCEFAVGIRSVLCEPRALHVYAGAGIVPGSDPDSEWAETDHKMRPILQ
ncbi:ADC synthase, partial [Baffinella frigidus]